MQSMQDVEFQKIVLCPRPELPGYSSAYKSTYDELDAKCQPKDRIWRMTRKGKSEIFILNNEEIWCGRCKTFIEDDAVYMSMVPNSRDYTHVKPFYCLKCVQYFDDTCKKIIKEQEL